MPVTLRLESESTLPIQVGEIDAGGIHGMSFLEIAKQKIWLGNQQLALGELFDVGGSVDDTIIWQGNLQNVHWIGARMTGGQVVLEGNAGRHIGSQMQSGEIVVLGNTCDFVGCEMSGGSIRVQGNAQNWIGSAYPGTRSGMTGGMIVIRGNAENAVGHAMRRGTICVSGSAGDLVGWNMLAGTIIIGGMTGDQTGLGMVRGTIVLAAQQSLDGDRLLLPTFKHSGRFRPVILQALCRSLNRTIENVSIPDCEYALYHGDALHGSRGEVYIACPQANELHPALQEQ